MNWPDSTPSSKHRRSSGIRGAYCALTSTSGTIGAFAQCRGPSACHQVADQAYHGGDDCDRDPREVVVKARVAPAEPPAAGGETEAEDGAAGEGERQEARERHARHSG